jgi:CDP-diacylglycerol--glycerol-3-phosphate 3-phosphatidyltransferase/cardiolipin synthase
VVSSSRTGWSAREVLRAPNLMSLARIPLAAAFPFVAGSPPLAVGVLGLAGLSDVLDGWLARRAHCATGLGQIIDPIADKTFALTVVVTLVARGALPLWALPILLVRELVEVPLALYALSSRTRREARVVRARANAPGKLDTVVLFATLVVAIAAPPALRPMLVVAALTGIVAAVSYGARELRGEGERIAR